MIHLPEFLYLVRHADAIDLADDAARPLSKAGREQVEALAQLLRPAQAFQPTEVWHSPLIRARETAHLLTRGLGLKAKLSVHAELVPEGDPAAVVAKLKHAAGAIALVAHEPLLSSLGSQLVTGATSPTAFVMPKAAILALERGPRHYRVRWHFFPELVR
jgi:phosphohistidine phosphatase